MAYSLTKKLDNFIYGNSDLVGEYESCDGASPIEYCKDEIIQIFKKIQKKNKTADLTRTLTDALTVSIASGTPLTDAMEQVATIQQKESTQNSLQQYFKEVNTVYQQHDNKYDFDYIPENRDKLISVNLKSVISQAKRYQGLGLSLQELISAGNLGLVIAWDKFDPSRAKLKDNIIDLIRELPNECSGEAIQKTLEPFLKYGDIKKKIIDHFIANHTFKKEDTINWVNRNIHNAKFSSIATMWIRAYILIEIDNCSRVVKKPKSEIYKDREKYGSYKKEVTLDIDAPVNNDSDTVFGDILNLENEDVSELEVIEAYDTFKDGLNKLLDGVKSRDRAIFLKKFGIGLPRPMLPKEIAEQEGLSIARISQIFQTVIEQMQKNSVKYNIDSNTLFDAVRKIQ